MQSVASVSRRLVRGTTLELAAGTACYAAAALWSAIWLVALLLAARRLSGALTAPPEILPLWLTAAAGALLAAGGRACWRTSRQFGDQACSADPDPAETSAALSSKEKLAAFLLRVAPAAGLSLLGCSLWLPGVSPAGIAGFFAIALAEEAWAARSSRRFNGQTDKPAQQAEPEGEPVAHFVSESPPATQPPLAPESESPPGPPSGGSPLAGPHFLPVRPEPPVPPGKRDFAHVEPAAPHFRLPPHEERDETPTLEEDEQLVQQLTRTATPAGAERLHATLLAQLPVDSRTASIHLAFCPPFMSLPRVQFEQTSGPAARIKLAQLLVHGARFDVKLQAPARQAETVCIEVTATWEPLGDDAATNNAD